ncbi:exodeoxyribonuclease III [Demequina sediminicola]|uniref:exodeoxyribonuclease III n=1 Tax=Demequina sediminicola TaxID=1095026 RepID=UPI0007851815|nr:exodeoxyribonuclease III [Demequina sediminicola]
MRLATWNVNSVRARSERIIDWLEKSDTDVLAMQEIKCKPEQFPREPFEAAGYELAIHGLNQWNGVAIASRVGIENVETSFPGQPAFGKPGQEPIVEARALGATCGDVRVWSLYVPNGRGLNDPHYAYKLQFLDVLKEQARQWADAPTALVGDFNVAPLTTDMWSEADADAETHVTPEARAAFHAFADAGYEELSRRFIPDEGKYTFWDYKQLRFPKNEGMRIDFIYGSQALADKATGVTIDRDERKGKGASDHVPVILDLED